MANKQDKKRNGNNNASINNNTTINAENTGDGKKRKGVAIDGIVAIAKNRLVPYVTIDSNGTARLSKTGYGELLDGLSQFLDNAEFISRIETAKRWQENKIIVPYSLNDVCRSVGIGIEYDRDELNSWTQAVKDQSQPLGVVYAGQQGFTMKVDHAAEKAEAIASAKADVQKEFNSAQREKDARLIRRALERGDSVADLVEDGYDEALINSIVASIRQDEDSKMIEYLNECGVTSVVDLERVFNELAELKARLDMPAQA